MSDWSGPMWKQTRTARKKERAREKGQLARDEKKNKATVRRRDKKCRIPLCGCRKLGLALKAFEEVSHLRHKGMGGNPLGDRSATSEMVLLCKHRHQDGRVSRHKGTLRAKFLTPDRFDGIIAWEIDIRALTNDFTATPAWRELARETSINTWGLLSEWQLDVLTKLAEMEI